MTVCAMFGCKNRMHKGCGKHFFRFPMKDPERLTRWIEAVQRDDWQPSIHSKVCSDHFTEKDYMIRPGAACPYLRMDAVPTPLYPIQRKKKTKKRKYTKKTAEPEQGKGKDTTQETPSGSGVNGGQGEEMETQRKAEEKHGGEERAQDGSQEVEKGVKSEGKTQGEKQAVEGQAEASEVGKQAVASQSEERTESEKEIVEVRGEKKAEEMQEGKQAAEGQGEKQVAKRQGEKQAAEGQEGKQAEEGKQVAEGQGEMMMMAESQGEQQVAETQGANMEDDQQESEDERVATEQQAHGQTGEAQGKKQRAGAQPENRLPDMTIVVNQMSRGLSSRPPCDNLVDYIPVDHAYSAVSGDKENDIPAPVADPKVVKLRRKIKALQKQVLRQGVKLKNLKKTLVDLRKNNMMDRDPEQVIAEHCSGLTQVLFTQQLKNGYRRHSVTQYCGLMKEFALSLYYASPKAYKFCRLFMCLPHPVSLRNWKAANDGNPGPSAEGSADEEHAPQVAACEGHFLNTPMQGQSYQEGHLPEVPMQEGHLSVIAGQEGHLSVIPGQEGHLSVIPVQERHLSVIPGQEGHLPEGPMQEGHLSVILGQEGHLSVIPGQERHLSVIPGQERHLSVIPGQEGQLSVIPVQERHLSVIPGQEGHLSVIPGQEGHLSVISVQGRHLQESHVQEGLQ